MAQHRQSTVDASGTPDRPGPLTRTILEYVQTIERLVPTVQTPADWGPLAEFVAVDDFERVGTFLEVQDWRGYTEMLTQWASSTSRFETTLLRVRELQDVVYFEIEERHFRRETVHVVNSLTVFSFNEASRICHLDVYLQQPR